MAEYDNVVVTFMRGVKVLRHSEIVTLSSWYERPSAHCIDLAPKDYRERRTSIVPKIRQASRDHG